MQAMWGYARDGQEQQDDAPAVASTSIFCSFAWPVLSECRARAYSAFGSSHRSCKQRLRNECSTHDEKRACALGIGSQPPHQYRNEGQDALQYSRVEDLTGLYVSGSGQLWGLLKRPLRGTQTMVPLGIR